MVIVISNPTSIKDEHLIINQLFDAGLECFHLRKPGSSPNELQYLLSRIEKKNHSGIALHQHHELADSFGIHRFHYTGEDRKSLTKKDLDKHNEKAETISTSIHDLEEYQMLSCSFDYVFFGPVFNSISKPDYNSTLKSDFKIPLLRKIKMIALGGIESSKITRIKEYGFDGAAVLGNIWTDPKKSIANFKSIKQEWER